MYYTKFYEAYEFMYYIHIFIDVYKLAIRKKKIPRFKFVNEETINDII